MRHPSLLPGNQNSRRNSGFTLIELIISIVLIGILAAMGSSMIANSFDTGRMVNTANASTAQARYALERLAREIREVRCVTPTGGNTCSYSISTPSTLPATLAILPGGGTLAFINNAGATITITGSGTTLNLNGSPLGMNVTGLSLDFSALDGTTPPTTSTIRFVVIDLTVTTDPTSGQSIRQRTRVALRNN